MMEAGMEHKAPDAVSNAELHLEMAMDYVKDALAMLPKDNIAYLTAGIIHDGIVDMRDAIIILKQQTANINRQ